MRNWNNPSPLKQSERIHGYQPTYEELKPLIADCIGGKLAQLPAYLWGIETTTEDGIASVHPGYQPTYEELKQ